eukprot:CAMPEP_0168341602 /NCGR_PEP_ID=MMETSP0213-20121227/14807_1 /TAXON_ID=151035 /ORGANISM="Euplotes harpa, Strain FSP1.4" /LENGTH=127 /DNA_ID=CAMNT_0008348161 /DNA_START=274 /DNA_END=657 /DNA_ORIENTATION=-
MLPVFPVDELSVREELAVDERPVDVAVLVFKDALARDAVLTPVRLFLDVFVREQRRDLERSDAFNLHSESEHRLLVGVAVLSVDLHVVLVMVGEDLVEVGGIVLALQHQVDGVINFSIFAFFLLNLL